MAAPTMEEYLAVDFDPSLLKVPQLRSILVEHGIPFGALVKKADLIDLFEDNVRPKATKLLAKASGVKASAKGIVSVSENGDEAPVEPLKRGRGRPRKTAPTVEVELAAPVPETEAKKRTRSRRSVESNASEDSLLESITATPQPTAAEPPKKRGRPRKLVKQEDDAPEDEEIPASSGPSRVRQSTSTRKITPAITPEPRSSTAPSSSRRTRMSSAAAPQTSPDVDNTPRPRSILKKEPTVQILDTHDDSEADSPPPRQTPVKRKATRTPRRSDDDSGFSDINPFQSGSEDAARKEIRRRKSSIGPIRDTPRQPRLSEPEPMSFTPGSALRRVGPSREALRSPPSDVQENLREERERELAQAEEHNQVVFSKLNEISSKDRASPPQIVITQEVAPVSDTTVARRVEHKAPLIPLPRRTIPLSALFLILLSWVASWKHASSAIGFCDTAGVTNDLVLHREAKIDNAQACIARNAALRLESTPSTELIRCDTSALPLLPFLPRPTACTPCPPHAVCEDGKLVACEHEYILSHHPLSIASPLVDGLPGFEPRVFTPTCKPDTAKKRMIGGLAQEMERYLARGRGKVICAGIGKEDGRKGEGERFGVEEEVLRETFDARRDPKFTKEQFDEIWEAALKDLIDHEDLIESIDVNGKSWYAASRADMTLACRAKTEAYKSLDAWKAQLGSTAAVLATILALQRTVKNRREEKYKAEDLAQVVLKRLQDQERLHYTDPATTPQPYLAPVQVRDLVLPHRGSVSSRTRLWIRIEALVEKNANVAVREQEVGGEIWRTWEWTGVGMLRGADD